MLAQSCLGFYLMASQPLIPAHNSTNRCRDANTPGLGIPQSQCPPLQVVLRWCYKLEMPELQGQGWALVYGKRGT